MGKDIFDSNKHLQHSNNVSRRDVIKGAISVGALAFSNTAFTSQKINFRDDLDKSNQSIIDNHILYNGERKDPVTGNYNLGNGYRAYNPSFMRFHAFDSLSPFGDGGINGYAYCMGDPINRRDPSGHFLIMSIILVAIVGAIIGSSIAATAEGIRAAATGTKFNWKQVAFGAVRGAISTLFGAVSVGVALSTFLWLSIAQASLTSIVIFGLNVKLGMSIKDAATDAGIGVCIGLASNVTGRLLSGWMNSVINPSETKYIELGGYMQKVDSPMEGIYFFEDTYKGAARLNIAAHGGLQDDGTGLVYLTNSHNCTISMDAEEVAAITKALYDITDYVNVRTLTCFSANGGTNSYSSQLSKLLNSPVKGYVGTVTANMEPGQFSALIIASHQNQIHSEFQNRVAQKLVFTLVKKNPHSYFSSSYWKHTYKPTYFNP